MYNLAKKNEYLEFFRKTAMETFQENKASFDLEDAMKNSDVDRIRELVRCLENNAIGAIPAGLPIPKVALYVSPTGVGEVTVVTVTLSNKVTSEKDFKFTYSATRGNTVEKLNDFMVDVFATLLNDNLIECNLEIVNNVLKEAVEEAGLPYTVSVVSPLNQPVGKKIASITDDSIEFIADESRVFSLDEMLVFHEPDELVSEELIQNAHQFIIDNIMESQTPEELVANHGGVLVEFVCDISKRVKPITLIKKVCGKDAKKLHGTKGEIGYFAKDNIYSLVALRDGHYEVVLSPFDTETLRKVDFDVIKALG